MSRSSRSPNFVEEEVELLVQLVHMQKDIFSLRKQDSDSNKLKDAAWEVVADAFNAHKPPNKRRTAKVLKIKLENVKKSMRNKVSRMREASTLDLKVQKLADYEELLLSIMTADGNGDGIFGSEVLDNYESTYDETSEGDGSFFKESLPKSEEQNELEQAEIEIEPFKESRRRNGERSCEPTEPESIFFEETDEEENYTKKAKKRKKLYEVNDEKCSESDDAKKTNSQLEKEKLLGELDTMREQLETAKENCVAAKEKREADKFKRKLELEKLKNDLEVSKLKLELIKMDVEIRKKEFNKYVRN